MFCFLKVDCERWSLIMTSNCTKMFSNPLFQLTFSLTDVSFPTGAHQKINDSLSGTRNYPFDKNFFTWMWMMEKTSLSRIITLCTSTTFLIAMANTSHKVCDALGGGGGRSEAVHNSTYSTRYVMMLVMHWAGRRGQIWMLFTNHNDQILLTPPLQLHSNVHIDNLFSICNR